MAMELMIGYNGNESLTRKAEENVVQEAASGLESIEKLVKLLSEAGQQYDSSSSAAAAASSSLSTKQPSMEIERGYKAVADIAILKFKRVISLLDQNRTGHARFRRAPLPSQQNQTEETQTKPLLDVIVFNATPLLHIPPTTTTKTTVHGHKNGTIQRKDSSKILNFSYSSAANSFMTSSLTNTKQRSSSSSTPAGTFQITNLSQVSSSGKPPLSSSSKRKCCSETLGSRNYSSSSSRCHCPNKRKLILKRVVRVKAISLNFADIPSDDYSWRKYGQKSIKGSPPHPRGYYKCTSVRGCPALKCVERALDDPSMLVVTYKGEHDHSLSAAEATNLTL